MDLQYEKIGKNYNHLVKADPLKKYIQYPAILKLLGNKKGRKILDIGCGNGVLSREIAKKGNFVTGFDISKEQIKDAKLFKSKNKEYKISNQQTFKSKYLFDEAICIMVLNYAKNKKELQAFFDCAYKYLKNNSKFIVLVFVPKKRDFNRIIFNRRFLEFGRNKIKAEFFTKGGSFSATVSRFSLNEYKNCAFRAGFVNIKSITPEISEEGLKKYSSKFWNGYNSSKPYKILVIDKK